MFYSTLVTSKLESLLLFGTLLPPPIARNLNVPRKSLLPYVTTHYLSHNAYITITFVVIGGIVVIMPLDPRFADSDPAKDDGTLRAITF
jgi:hypothetical protein